MEAEIEYAWNGETSLAYQVLEGPEPGLLYLQGYLSNVELNADHPPFARFLRELARINRVVVADRRGLGCSERFTPADTPALEDLLADVSAVLDAAGCNRCTLFATGECGPLACLFAATFPDRISALVLWATAATWKVSEETPWGHSAEEHEAAARVIRDHLGDGSWTRARTVDDHRRGRHGMGETVRAPVAHARLGRRERPGRARARARRSTRPATASSPRSTGPLRGILCAQAIVEAMHTLGIEVRAGLHTGDVERVGDQLAGVASTPEHASPHLARPSEVLVSQTVKDLVVAPAWRTRTGACTS